MEELIEIIHHGVTWEEGIKLGVDLLVKQGIATEELTDAIIKTTNDLGPYYVLMPKLALAHTSPGEYNKKVGISLIFSKKPIKFSDDDKHDVNLLFVLSAVDGNSHMNIIQKFANLFSDGEMITKVLNCKNKIEVYDLLKDIFI